MYLVECKHFKTDDDKKSFQVDNRNTMFLPASFIQKVQEADRYELWGTNFMDAGNDYTDHILIKNSRTIAEVRVMGY